VLSITVDSIVEEEDDDDENNSASSSEDETKNNGEITAFDLTLTRILL
jgi:hypothetical protein